MARVELPIVVLNSSTGLPVAGAAIAATLRGSGTPATWYASETGGSGSTSSIITDSAGRANAWLDRGAYNLAITGTGITPYTEPWDAVPAGDGTFDVSLIADGTIPLAKLVAAVQQSLNPVGTVLPYAGSAAPTGYLLADGSAVNRTTYAALFTAIGTAYGAGDGTTTFNLPNFRGQFPVGRDAVQTEFDTLGEVGGAKTVTLTSAQSGMPAHTHADTFAITAANAVSAGSVVPRMDSTNAVLTNNTAIGSNGVAPVLGSGATGWFSSTLSHTHTISGAVSSASGVAASSSHPNLPPYQVVNFIIKT